MRCWLPPIHCLVVALSLTGCTAHLAPPASVVDSAPLSVVSCRTLYSDVDAWVKGAAVGDAQSARVSDYPYLRIDRFLAADEVKPGADSEDFDAWLARLRNLDSQARTFELRNLPDDPGGERRSRFDRAVDAHEVVVREVPEPRLIAAHVFVCLKGGSMAALCVGIGGHRITDTTRHAGTMNSGVDFSNGSRDKCVTAPKGGARQGVHAGGGVMAYLPTGE